MLGRNDVGSYPDKNIMKPYLENSIMPLLPINIKSRIQEVEKTCYSVTSTTASTIKSVEKLWIPSVREISGIYEYTSKEDSGVIYNTIYSNASSRIKKKNGTASAYWTRSAESYDGSFATFTYVAGNGAFLSEGGGWKHGIALGFCLGLEPPTLDSITATIDSSAQITDENTLDDLKQYLTITANYSNGTTKTVTDYTLSGTLTVGVSTITVSYNEKTTTFDVTVAEEPKVDIKKYLNYTTDETNNTMTITGLNTSLIVSDQLEEIRIPDTIDGYHVILG